MTGHVVVFAAGRADLSPLRPVLAALAAADELRVTLLALSGVHLDGVEGVEVEQLADEAGSAVYVDITAGGVRISAATAAAVVRLHPDAAVVLGDRWELLYHVPPLVLAGVPVVHLHGGEVTEGAIDDRIRHAVTKLADLHCVSTDDAAARVRQLGEPADRVVVTGAPGLDAMTSVVAADDAGLSALLGRPVTRPFGVVTYHPPTVGDIDPGEAASAVFAAVAQTLGSAVITHPGLDTGREAVLRAIQQAVATAPQLVAVSTLGPHYLPVLAAADVMVGNSSSGIIEAGSLGVPVVDVGDRQHGRARGRNVVSVAEDRDEIAAAIRSCLEPQFRLLARSAGNPYGDGHAAARIVAVVRRAVAAGLARKPFVDVAVPR